MDDEPPLDRHMTFWLNKKMKKRSYGLVSISEYQFSQWFEGRFLPTFYNVLKSSSDDLEHCLIPNTPFGETVYYSMERQNDPVLPAKTVVYDPVEVGVVKMNGEREQYPYCLRKSLGGLYYVSSIAFEASSVEDLKHVAEKWQLPASKEVIARAT